VTILTGPSGDTTDNTPSFTWQGADNDGYISGYYISIDHDPPQDWTNATTWTTPELSEGYHTFRVIAVDDCGTNSSTASWLFKVVPGSTNIPPTVKITGGPTGNTTDKTPTFTYQGTDNDGTISGYYVNVDVNPPNIWTESEEWTSAELSIGPHTFHVMAEDNDGGLSDVMSRSFYVIKQSPPDEIVCQYNLRRLKTDHFRNLIYGIDYDNGMFIVLDVSGRYISKVIPLGGNPYDLDITKDGGASYVSLRDTEEIIKIDLADLTITKRIPIDQEMGMIACGRAGRVYLAEWNQWCSVRIIDTENGSIITSYGSWYSPGICTNSDGSVLYVTESGSSSSGTNAYDITLDNGTLYLDSAPDCGYSSEFLFINQDDSRLFYDRHWTEADNMQHDHGRTDQGIYAVAADGSLMMGESSVFYASTFTFALGINGSRIMAVAHGDNELFVYLEEKEKIQIVDLSGIPQEPVLPSSPTYDASRILSDPNRDAIYVLDKVANTLMFFNTSTLALEKTVFIGSRPNDMDIDKAGNYLYITCWGGRETAVVDLVTREKVRSIFVPAYGAYPDYWLNIACGREGRLYYAEGDQWCKIYVFDSENNMIIHRFSNPTSGSWREPDMLTDPTGRFLFVGEDDHNGECHKLDMAIDDSPVHLSKSDDGMSGRIISADVNVDYIFDGKWKYDADNLSIILATFDGVIWSCTMDGSYACSESKVYNASTGAYFMDLPVKTRYVTSDRASTKLILYDNSLPGLRAVTLP
jgi:DNA-binding beta-propeller fold protein YncE